MPPPDYLPTRYDGFPCRSDIHVFHIFQPVLQKLGRYLFRGKVDNQLQGDPTDQEVGSLDHAFEESTPLVDNHCKQNEESLEIIDRNTEKVKASHGQGEEHFKQRIVLLVQNRAA